jgi:hypothetical protein
MTTTRTLARCGGPPCTLLDRGGADLPCTECEALIRSRSAGAPTTITIRAPIVNQARGLVTSPESGAHDAMNPVTPPSAHAEAPVTDAMCLAAMMEFSAPRGESHSAMWEQLDTPSREAIVGEWRAVLECALLKAPRLPAQAAEPVAWWIVEYEAEDQDMMKPRWDVSAFKVNLIDITVGSGGWKIHGDGREFRVTAKYPVYLHPAHPTRGASWREDETVKAIRRDSTARVEAVAVPKESWVALAAVLSDIHEELGDAVAACAPPREAEEH